jgi:sugar/nucleoside kinase (ribokinase family)
MTLGGSSSILAHNLCHTRYTHVGFVSARLGATRWAASHKHYLEASGVDLSTFRQKPGAKTGVTLLLPHGKKRHILTYPGVMSELTVA